MLINSQTKIIMSAAYQSVVANYSGKHVMAKEEGTARYAWPAGRNRNK